MSSERSQPALRRALTLPLLTLYGLGVTVGAGIYVLIGVTVAQAGPLAWLAFLVAAIVVAFTALSYAELATRFPVSAGEAAYIDAGFRSPLLSTGVGLLVAATGMISASAITIGAAGYLTQLTGLDVPILVIGIVVSMGMLAAWGITQSVIVAATVTVIEICGLLFVIGWSVGFSDLNGVALPELITPTADITWVHVFNAALLAFFAFIGFEDMVNVAEEVKDPRRTIPRAIFYTLVLATVLYVATCIAVLLAVPVAVLAGSAAPLTLVFQDAPDYVRSGFAVIAVVATVNGVLIQMIMASRVLFGLAKRGRLPSPLARLSEGTQTPVLATICVAVLILSLSLWMPIDRLAAWTSQIVLGVFMIVNLALVVIKRRAEPVDDYFSVPVWVPVCGIISSAALLATSVL